MRLEHSATLVLLTLSLGACGVDVCEGETPPKPFEAVIDDFPSEAVFCAVDPEEGGLQRVDFPAPGENWPAESVLPNQAHLNFQLETPHDAWMKLVDQFESKGWERISQSTDDFLAVSFAHEKGYILNFSIINNNSSKSLLKKDRVHAHLVIRQAPCQETGGSFGAACLDNTLVSCTNGVVTGEVDCGAEQQTCASDDKRAACVSDLCLAGKAGGGEWSAEACPKEIVGP